MRFSRQETLTPYAERVIKDGKVNLATLLPDTKYYAQVFSKDGEACSEKVSFVTETCTVRPLRCTDGEGFGPRNVRDIGGYVTPYGKVKYGMLYRGSLFNNRYNNRYRMTEGVRERMKELGIRAEIDLRVSGDDDSYYSEKGEKLPQTANEIDSSLPYYKLPTTAYDTVFSKDEPRVKNIPEIFRLLGKKENYPVYLHCNAGADRTGTIVFLVHCLLGVSYEDAMRCYEATTFSPEGKRSRAYVQQDDQFNYIKMGKFCEQLLTYGDNYQTATENFLRSLGLTDGEMQAVGALLIEKI